MKWSKLILLLAITLVACKTTEEPVEETPSVQTAQHMQRSAKRGVAFNFVYLSDLPLLSPYISWDYNWGNTPSDNAADWFDINDIDFCPMCWNGNYNADKIRAFVAAHPKTKYLLAFNEPNLKDQARMTPSEAAAIWQPVVDLAKELNLKLVSPAMNYGTLENYSDPIKWMDEFFALVGTSDIYAISVHCYMASVGGLKTYIERFRKYDKPVWLTEFCAWDPKPSSEEVQLAYMSDALNYLEQESLVERYAWFIPRYTGGNDPFMRLITKDEPGELTAAGKIYCGFSSFDKQTYLNTSWIPVGSYCTVNGTVPNVRPSTDAQLKDLELPLMITNVSENMTLEYKVSLNSSASKFSIRTTGYTSLLLRVYVDGTEITTLAIDPTKGIDNWTTSTADISVSQQPAKGAHTIRLEWLKGNGLASGFSLQ